MQRATPYRSKPSEQWQALRGTLDQTTLFLVGRIGPTVFNIRDESGESYRTSIGSPHSCSCNKSNADVMCIHQLFAILKVLRVPDSHPLAYQSSYTDSETDQVLSGSLSQDRRSAVRGKPFLKKKATSVESEEAAAENNDGFVSRQVMDDEEESPCPICQDEMTNEQALSWCRKGCGNNIHAKCMQNYAQYKISNRDTVTCPLCREDWLMDHLKNDCRGKASLKHSCSPVYCASCTFPQRTEFTRCIECSNSAVSTGKKPVDFCPRCFTGTMSREHALHHFLKSDASVSNAADCSWQSCKNPRAPPKIVDPELLRELQERELTTGDYDLLMGLDRSGPPDLPTQLLNSLIGLGKVKSDNNNSGGGSVDVTIVNSMCWCNRIGDEAARRYLACRHTAHDACITKELLRALSDDTSQLSELLVCKHASCKVKMFPGLNRKRKKKAIVTDSGGAESLSSSSSAGKVDHEGSSKSEVTSAGGLGLGIGAISGQGLGLGIRGCLRIGSALATAGAMMSNAGTSSLDGGTTTGSVPNGGGSSRMGTTGFAANRSSLSQSRAASSSSGSGSGLSLGVEGSAIDGGGGGGDTGNGASSSSRAAAADFTNAAGGLLVQRQGQGHQRAGSGAGGTVTVRRVGGTLRGRLRSLSAENSTTMIMAASSTNYSNSNMGVSAVGFNRANSESCLLPANEEHSQVQSTGIVLTSNERQYGAVIRSSAALRSSGGLKPPRPTANRHLPRPNAQQQPDDLLSDFQLGGHGIISGGHGLAAGELPGGGPAGVMADNSLSHSNMRSGTMVNSQHRTGKVITGSISRRNRASAGGGDTTEAGAGAGAGGVMMTMSSSEVRSMSAPAVAPSLGATTATTSSSSVSTARPLARESSYAMPRITGGSTITNTQEMAQSRGGRGERSAMVLQQRGETSLLIRRRAREESSDHPFSESVTSAHNVTAADGVSGLSLEGVRRRDMNTTATAATYAVTTATSASQPIRDRNSNNDSDSGVRAQAGRMVGKLRRPSPLRRLDPPITDAQGLSTTPQDFDIPMHVSNYVSGRDVPVV